MKEFQHPQEPKKKIEPLQRGGLYEYPKQVRRDLLSGRIQNDPWKAEETKEFLSFPKPEDYTKHEVDHEVLETVIEQSPLLQQVAEVDPVRARYLAYLREQVEKVVPSQEGKRTAYYPGIGGGNEPLDPLSAFVMLDVDKVIGVDLLSGRNADEARVDTMLEKKLENSSVPIKVLDADATSAAFELDGKKRELIVHKGDVRTFTPFPIPPIIYQRREVELIDQLPAEVVDSAKLIFCQDNHTTSARIAKAGLEKGFNAVDMGHVYKIIGEKKIWIGDPQLLIRFPESQQK